MPKSLLPGPIAVIDVETTGLFPSRHHRVIEVAAVVLDGDGRIVREFESLVNPGRDIGPSSIHGLTAGDLLHAPQFGDIAGLLVETLRGTLAIAGHQVRFDQSFIESEFSRIGCSFPACHAVCTMQLAGRRRLIECCNRYGIPMDGEAHRAGTDARAAARLLATLLPSNPHIVQHLGRLKPIEWPAVSVTEKQPTTRAESRRRQEEPPTFLQRLLGRMPTDAAPIATEGAVMDYMALLDRILEDRHVDESEGDALIELATHWGLTADQIDVTHREYMNQLALGAVADGVVTEAERRDLKLVARLLGQQNRDLDQMLQEAAGKVASRWNTTMTPNPDASLIGKRVCFTGEHRCRYQGQLISRDLAEELAREAGLVVMGSVTKKLDLLVVADPHSQSGKAKKARQYGIRVMQETVFWKTIGVAVE